jgi:hypothetical protein
MSKFLFLIALSLLLSVTAGAQLPESDDPPNASGTGYGNNILSFVPAFINNNGRGAGICYERILDENGKFSLYVPLLLSYQKLAWHYREQYKTRSLGGLFGFKFYPTSSRGVVRYAMGLSVAVYSLQRTYEMGRSMMFTYADYKKENYTKTGLLFNNSINVTVSGKVNLSLDLHLGVCDSNEPDFDSTEPFVLLMFKAGYRF